MLDGMLKAITSQVRAMVAFLPAMVLVYAWSAHAQVGGGGPDPIPLIHQDTGGGTNPTVTFDPSTSYLPAPPANQTYQYTLFWDFGDGSSIVTVGPGTAAQVLVSQVHTFTNPTSPPGDFTKTFTITLQIDITVTNQSNTTSAGPSAKTTSSVRSAFVNYNPTCVLVNNSSPATGDLPYQLNVDPSGSFDEDGFIIWAAIDWGDGSYDLLHTLPPSTSAISALHSYTSPGSYTVTLSIIDNGRMAAGTALDPTPAPNDPYAALATIKNLQHTLIDNGVLLGPIDPNTGITIFNENKYLPSLRQSSIQVQIPGNLLVVKGKFTADFRNVGNDSFDCTFYLNGSVASVANAQVSVFLGNTQILSQFTTDLKGNYFNSAQKLKFTITPKKHYMRFQIGSAALQNAFNLQNATVINGYVDIPIRIVITGNGGTTSLAAKLRFVYNAKAGVKGTGTNPRSTLVGG